jgi:hypothetical protein
MIVSPSEAAALCPPHVERRDHPEEFRLTGQKGVGPL